MSEDDAITEDRLLGGQVTIFQPQKGFRAGTDSVLLGASLSDMAYHDSHLLEFGCGAGGALLTAAHHLPESRLTGVEQDADMAALADRSVQANGFGDRAQVVHSEAALYSKTRENSVYLTFANPPYFERGRISAPQPDKTDAYLENITLDDWLKAMLFVTAVKGWVVMIHRTAELARILTRLDRQAGDISILPIRPYPGAEAKRVLVRARKGVRRGSLRLLGGLDLHASKGGALTERADAILKGMSLDWI